MKGSIKKYWNKFWFLLWKDDSLKGWIFSVIFLFVFIMFIFFPLLRLSTGTSLPIAIVETCSMYHKGDLFGSFDTWWESHYAKYLPYGIKKENFSNYIYPRGFNKGDILFMIKANPNKLKVGDVIIFDSGVAGRNPIIHRIISIREENGQRIFSTMGDNNNGQLSFEKEISENRLVAKSVFKIVPFLGWTKLIFYEPLRPSSERGLCVGN